MSNKKARKNSSPNTKPSIVNFRRPLITKNGVALKIKAKNYDAPFSNRAALCELKNKLQQTNSNPETFINCIKVWEYANEVEKQNKYAQKMQLSLEERKAIKRAKRDAKNVKYIANKKNQEIAKMKREVDLHIIRLKNNLK